MRDRGDYAFNELVTQCLGKRSAETIRELNMIKSHESTPGELRYRRSVARYTLNGPKISEMFSYVPLKFRLQKTALYMQEQAHDNMSSTSYENQIGGTDVLSQLVEAACGAAIKKALNITDIPPRP